MTRKSKQHKQKPLPKLTDAERFKRFHDMAREVGASDNPEDFEKALKQVVSQKRNVPKKRS